MAVARAELEIPEVAGLLERLSDVKRGDPLYRARRELERSLKRGREAEAREKENMRRIRANRRVPGFDETPLIPHRRRKTEAG